MKEIKETHTKTLDIVGKRKQLVIIETDDYVRYVFLKTFDDQPIRFSHRHYPNRKGGDKINKRNSRLPKVVEDYVEENYVGYTMMDGMIEEAKKNKQTFSH